MLQTSKSEESHCHDEVSCKLVNGRKVIVRHYNVDYKQVSVRKIIRTKGWLQKSEHEEGHGHYEVGFKHVRVKKVIGNRRFTTNL